MATGDSVLPDSITDPNANQNNMTAGSGAAINLDTYCILYPDGTRFIVFVIIDLSHVSTKWHVGNDV